MRARIMHNRNALVSIGWVKEHLNDPKVKLVEVDVDTTSYDKGQHQRGHWLELADAIAGTG